MTTARSTQRAQVLALLRSAHGGWVPLPTILALGIAQYNARVFELRRSGYQIENRSEVVDGSRHSFFRLVEKPSILPKGNAQASDWFERDYGPRPKVAADRDLPLFNRDVEPVR